MIPATLTLVSKIKFDPTACQPKKIDLQKEQNSNVKPESSRPEPHYDFTAFFLLRTDEHVPFFELMFATIKNLSLAVEIKMAES